MKTRTWIFLFLGVFLLLALSVLLLTLNRTPVHAAEITVDGALWRTVDLSRDQSFTVNTPWGSNTVAISDGCIAVIQTDCPDGLCQKQGFQNSGMPIVCLPHRLVIRFPGDAA